MIELCSNVRTIKCDPVLASEMVIGNPLDCPLGKRKVQYSDRVRNPDVACPKSRFSMAGISLEESKLPCINGRGEFSSNSARKAVCNL